MFLVSIVPCDSCVPENVNTFRQLENAVNYGIRLVMEAEKIDFYDDASREAIRKVISEDLSYEGNYSDNIYGDFIVSIVEFIP